MRDDRRQRFRPEPWLSAVIAVGVVLRVILVPMTHGEDFIVWDRASAATLRGINIYAHHPDYPGGPFAYFPSFVYVEVPFQWLAQNTGISFTILGKLPIALGDLACTMLLAEQLRSRGYGPRTVALTAAAFLLNPLVLYNSAYYGRFDTVGCALLLAALAGIVPDVGASIRRASCYALAVTIKTFPLFLLAGVLRQARGHARRVLVVLSILVVAVSAPYLAAPVPFVHDILYDTGKLPAGLSWQHLLSAGLTNTQAVALSIVVLGLFLLGSIWLARIGDLRVYTVLTLLLFLLCSKVVLEQYLIWPLPWLLLLSCDGQRRMAGPSMALAGLLTAIGTIDNETFHPFGRSSPALIVILAAGCLAYVAFALVETSATKTSRVAQDVRHSA